MYATLLREYHPEVTVGTLRMYYDRLDIGQDPIVTIKTIELPWKDNARCISCIPEGRYVCTPRESDKFGKHFHIRDVPDRSWILFHVANYISDLEGCIAVGRYHADIDQDGIMDVAQSRLAMNALLRHGGYLREGFIVHILSENGAP